MCVLQSEHVFEITPKDWTHLINTIVWFQFYKFYWCAKSLFFLFTCSRLCYKYIFRFVVAISLFRGGRRFCKIYGVLPLYRLFRRGRIRIYTRLYYLSFWVCDYFLFYFPEKKIGGNRIALNATKEIAIMFQF